VAGDALELRNPHSVLAALRARPGEVRELRLPGGRPHEAWRHAIDLAEREDVPVRALDEARSRGARAGYAVVAPRAETALGDLVANDGRRALWLAIDGVQDPQNLGSIFRSAAFFGVRGVILARDRAAPLTAVAYDVATGGVEHVPFTTVTNLRRAIERARKAGLWVLGSSEHAERSVEEVDADRPWLLALGGEEQGLRRLTLESCDEVCRIPAAGELTSLNVGVAAGVLMAALTR
jgi:23S rRNA (guanosine2251-2'-O)-methyltransferase